MASFLKINATDFLLINGSGDRLQIDGVPAPTPAPTPDETVVQVMAFPSNWNKPKKKKKKPELVEAMTWLRPAFLSISISDITAHGTINSEARFGSAKLGIRNADFLGDGRDEREPDADELAMILALSE